MTEVMQDLGQALAAGVEANPLPDPPRDDGASDIPPDDNEEAKERGLSALNQMHEELQEKRRHVEAYAGHARLRVKGRLSWGIA
jgi:hypothetical protein